MARINRVEEIAKFYNVTTNVYDPVTIRLRFDYDSITWVLNYLEK